MEKRAKDEKFLRSFGACISNQTLENYFPEPELYVRVHSFLKTLKVTVGPDVRSETEASAGQTSDTGNSFRLPEIVPGAGQSNTSSKAMKRHVPTSKVHVGRDSAPCNTMQRHVPMASIEVPPHPESAATGSLDDRRREPPLTNVDVVDIESVQFPECDDTGTCDERKREPLLQNLNIVDFEAPTFSDCTNSAGADNDSLVPSEDESPAFKRRKVCRYISTASSDNEPTSNGKAAVSRSADNTDDTMQTYMHGLKKHIDARSIAIQARGHISSASTSKPSKSPPPSPTVPSEARLWNESESNMMNMLLADHCEITADGQIPTANDFAKMATEYPMYGMIVNKQSVKRFNTISTYRRNSERAKTFLEAHARTTHLPDIARTVKDFFQVRGWNVSAKVVRMCKSMFTGRQVFSRRMVDENNRKELKEIEFAINTQQWPLIKKKRVLNKGTGIVSNSDIKKGTLLCDFHGTLLNDKEGQAKYESYGDSDKNVSMLSIEYGGRKYWIDSVARCKCHPTMETKGRFFNHTRKKPNACMKVMEINDVPRVLLYASRDIPVFTQLEFDYGCYGDRKSSRQEWM
ncbi:MAG: SET domain-containing protein-lysine N-methyltransferase [Sedimenticola sp.]